MLSGCSAGPTEIVLSGPTMGTTYTVHIVAPPQGLTAHDVRVLVDEELLAVDESMSGYREDSEVSRFNATASRDWFDVSPALAHVVDAALEVAERSSGAFDITVARLVQAWGFGPQTSEGMSLPTEAQIESLREKSNGDSLQARTDPPALRKREPEMKIDLNGIAPGYAVDKIAARLDALALRNYMIDIGGEIRVRGRNKAGEPWRIAVERPDASGQPFMILRLQDRAIATSGEYRHFREREGRRYSHTIDPRTGSPIARAAASVVVIHKEAMYADAWATAFNVLGPVDGYALAVRLDMPVMYIVEGEGGGFEAKRTPAFERLLEGGQSR
jgi:thiamine biosynthesis lipoprotein